MSYNRVIVKNKWEDAATDAFSYFFWTCFAWFVFGGMVVTGLGAWHGYVNTPKDQDPAPAMMREAGNFNVAVWKFIGGALNTTAENIHEMRPEGEVKK